MAKKIREVVKVFTKKHNNGKTIVYECSKCGAYCYKDKDKYCIVCNSVLDWNNNDEETN